MSTDATTIIVRNAHVLTMDDQGQEWPDADIVIQGAVITAVGPNAAAAWLDRATRVIDGHGVLAMPGLINAHFHSPGNFMKGSLEGMPLELFMLYEVPPLAAALAGEDIAAQANRFTYVRTLLGAVEMLRRGITTVHDDAYHVPIVTHDGLDAMLQAYANAGIRATVAIDQPNIVEYGKYPFLRGLLPDDERARMDAAPLQSEAELLAAYNHLITRWHNAAGGRLQAAVSCSAPQRVTPSYFRALSMLSKQHDLPFNIHVLETRLQRVLGQEVFGESLVKYVHRLGLLDERMMVIHAIWVDDEDIALLAASGCTVAHNPVCNLRLGSGIMPWRKLADAGVPLCLGTDEMNTDDTTNLWAVAKLAGMIHSLADADCRRWPQAAEVLHAAIRGGARAIRQGANLGQLKAGFKADLILLDLDTHAFTPLNDLQRQLVFCEDGSSVRFAIVDGRVVFEDGRIAGLDEKALRAEARALHASFQAVAAGQSTDAERLAPYYRAMLERAQAIEIDMAKS